MIDIAIIGAGIAGKMGSKNGVWCQISNFCNSILKPCDYKSRSKMRIKIH